MRILIVDDIEENLYLLESLLKGSGYEVVAAKDGVEALDKLKKEPIDIIISDILMPRMDGFQLCRECKKDENLRKIPFIFYTATYTEKKDEEFALSLGVERFIVKPQEPKVLLKILGEVIEEHEKGALVTSKEIIKEEEIYLTGYNKRLIQKLEKKVLDLNKRTNELKERVKELNCLWEISNLIEKPDISLEAIIKGTVNLLPSAWQYPQIICARIILEAKEYKTKNFKETIWKQSSDIIANKKPIGTIEVYYLEERPQRDEGPFLKEERNLINIIAERLGKIIERKQSEEEIQLHAAMMDNVAEGVYLIGLDDLLIKWTNEKFARMFGYDPGEIVGKQVDIINAPTERTPAETRIAISDALRETGEWHGEVKNIKRDGTHFWCYANISLFDHPEYGKIMVAVSTDITERKKAEEQIKDSEKRLKILFDYAPDAYYISDLKGKFIDGNKVAERLMGYKREELIGSSFLKLKLLSLADIPKAAKLLVKNLRGQPTGPDEFILNRKDNSKVTVEISTYPVKIKERTLVLGIARDITERKQAEQKLLQSHNKLLKTMEDTIYTIGKITETRDPYTAGHQKTVSQIAVFIAQEMKLPKDKIEGVRIASLVHDIGKNSVPAEILNKPIKLSDIEFNLIKDHSQTGHDILKSIEFPWPVARIVLQHHERLNGSGYPQGLKGEDILLEARIIGVADVIDAMSSHRPYRPALGIDVALEEISKNKGIFYDPEVVDACIKLFKEKRFKF
ncbi:Sensor histidine kinase RcsC [subsurface metagenome]